jgi:hypothetical protein
MRSFVTVYVRSTSLRYVSEKRLNREVAHGTIDNFIHGSEPTYATRQLLRKLFFEESVRDLPTDPDPRDAALYLVHLLNRIPDEHQRAVYERIVRCIRHAHIEVGAEVPPWLERVAALYEDDGPSDPPPPAPPPPPPPDTGGGPPEYPRKPRGRRR